MADNLARKLELSEPSEGDLAVVRSPRRRWVWFVAGAAVGLVGVLAATVALIPSELAWETTEATVGDLATRVTAVGQLEPVTTVDVGSDLSGTVSRVLVAENQRVAKGDLLAELDPEPFESALAQVSAQVASARASLDKARVDLQSTELSQGRTERLEARGAASPVDTETAGTQTAAADAGVRMAQAQLAQTSAALRNARQDLEKTVIVAPIDGVVIHRLVEPGQTVVSAMQVTPLFEVASDLAELKVDVGVDEADVGQVRAGQPATFTVSAWPDRTFDATVVAVDLAPAADSDIVSYGAELRVANPDGLLRPGMTATAAIEVAAVKDAVRVPALALRWHPPDAVAPEGDTVWVLVDGAPVAVPVTVLGSDGVHTAVSGIEAGAAVVVGGGL